MIVFLTLLVSASTIKFFTDPVVYKTTIEMEDTVTHEITSEDIFYVEFNCEIPYQELHYESTDSIIHSNTILPFRIVDLDRPDSLVDTLYRQFTIPSFSYAAKEQASFLVQFGLYLTDGRFRYRIEIHSGEKTGISEAELEINEADYMMSDILLSSEIASDTTGDYLRKGNLRVIPRPSHTFNNRFKNLYFYYELYETATDADTLTAVYTILDGEGNVVRRVSRTIEKILPAQAVNCGFDIQGIAAGDYDLVVTIEDADENIVTKKDVPFSIFRVQQREASYENMPFYDQIEYLLTPQDYRKYTSLPEDGKKAFLDRFWRIHDYHTIAERFQYAEEHYRRGDTPGHKTDRGRIYVKYGQPDEIERPLPLQLEESKPFEYWQYLNGEQFIFVDISGTNDYILVWTNALDETGQPTLYKYLPLEQLDIIQ